MINKELVDPDPGNLKVGKPREWRNEEGDCIGQNLL